MSDDIKGRRVKVTVYLRPHEAEALKERAAKVDRDVCYEGGRIIGERLQADGDLDVDARAA